MVVITGCVQAVGIESRCCPRADTALHKHTRLVLILSSASILAVAGLLLLQRQFIGLRGPVTVMSGQGMELGTDVPAATGEDAPPDAETRAAFTSPTAPADPRPAGHAGTAPGAAAGAKADGPFALEGALVQHAGLSVREADRLLEAEDFPRRLGDYAAESAADPDAAELTTVYRAALERALRDSGVNARLDGFACGTRLCAGALGGGGPDDYTRWSEYFVKAATVPTYAFHSRLLERPDGPAVLRFTFSVDPALNAIVIDPP